jgi:DNA-directed RNA polymerase subunit D
VVEEDEEYKMKLEKVREEKKKNKLSFLVKGSDEVFTNTIRRLIAEEVPVLAIEDLEIRDNNSALYDEMVGLRLGLCPIKTDLKSYDPKDECKCGGEGCAKCELKISIKCGRNGYVYCEDAESTDPKCTFAYPKMPIVKLLAKQKVDINMTAVMGRGKNHVKWSPGLAFYKKEPSIKIGAVKDAQLIADSCAAKVFDVKAGKLSINKDNLYDCLLCDKCVELDKAISLEETGNYLFNLESWGQLNCKEILIKAADILNNKIVELEKQI